MDKRNPDVGLLKPIDFYNRNNKNSLYFPSCDPLNHSSFCFHCSHFTFFFFTHLPHIFSPLSDLRTHLLSSRYNPSYSDGAIFLSSTPMISPSPFRPSVHHALHNYSAGCPPEPQRNRSSRSRGQYINTSPQQVVRFRGDANTPSPRQNGRCQTPLPQDACTPSSMGEYSVSSTGAVA